LARLTRQQLKRDQFAVTFSDFTEFYLSHQKKIVQTGGIILLGLAVVVGGFLLYRSSESKAATGFATALATFHAPVSATDTAASTLHFKTDQEKYQEALKQFNDVADHYSWFSQGKFARYYSALCQRELGKTAEAEKALHDVAESHNAELSSIAKMALAGIYEQTGRNDQAEKTYKELENHATTAVPKATVQLALADLYQRTKPAEAKAIYQQIQKDYPGMAAGDVASRMLQAQAQ